MKKNSIAAFEGKAAKIEEIFGGYRYDASYNSGGTKVDEELFTAFGEINPQNGTRCESRGGCQDSEIYAC